MTPSPRLCSRDPHRLAGQGVVRITHSVASLRICPGSEEVTLEAPSQTWSIFFPLVSSACTQPAQDVSPTGCARVSGTLGSLGGETRSPHFQ